MVRPVQAMIALCVGLGLSQAAGCSSSRGPASAPPPGQSQPPPARPPAAATGTEAHSDTAATRPAQSPAVPGFLAAARARRHVFWRLGSACQEWQLAGDRTGTISRLDPAPALRFDYKIAHGDLVMFGDPRLGAVGERSLESLCRERVPLKSAGAAALTLGDGAWYWSRAACQAQDARPAPGPCSAPMATHVVVDSSAPDMFRYVYDHEGPVAVISSTQGQPSCETRRFRSRRGQRELVEMALVKGAWREKARRVSLSGAGAARTVTIGGGPAATKLPVVAVSRGLVLVGGYPWFLDSGTCDRLVGR